MKAGMSDLPPKLPLLAWHFPSPRPDLGVSLSLFALEAFCASHDGMLLHLLWLRSNDLGGGGECDKPTLDHRHSLTKYHQRVESLM